jgi:hypothetical protein
MLLIMLLFFSGRKNTFEKDDTKQNSLAKIFVHILFLLLLRFLFYLFLKQGHSFLLFVCLFFCLFVCLFVFILFSCFVFFFAFFILF